MRIWLMLVDINLYKNARMMQPAIQGDIIIGHFDCIHFVMISAQNTFLEVLKVKFFFMFPLCLYSVISIPMFYHFHTYSLEEILICCVCCALKIFKFFILYMDVIVCLYEKLCHFISCIKSKTVSCFFLSVIHSCYLFNLHFPIANFRSYWS